MPTWEKIESRAGYTFWKYEDHDGKMVYNCTMDKNPPNGEAGYYSYAYLLKVKGVIPGVTLNSIFQAIADELKDQEDDYLYERNKP